MNEIKIWAQMFFDDGSVSQGIRVPAAVLDNKLDIVKVAKQLLKSVNRREGHLLLWGAGNIHFSTVMWPNTSASSDISEQESDS